jgi:Zn-dependent peptidase ImmA (M78 family)/transcriptional regulator with XRE-family HTH domain
MSKVNEEQVAALGARVRGERERRGWTQRDLETHSGLDHVRIHRIETDPKQSVRIEEILSLAKAFGVSGRWLIKGPEVQDRLVVAARCRDEVNAVAAIQSVAHYVELANALDEVNDATCSADVTAYAQELTNNPRVWGKKVAAAIRKGWGAQTGPLHELPALIESHTGILVALQSLPDDVDGIAVRDPQTGNALIAVSTHCTWERQRFTIAHELGHILAGDQRVEAVTGNGNSAIETRAHEFARNFLVPATDLRALSADDSEWTAARVAKVAWEYQVSPTVVAIQLSRNGIAPDSVVQQASAMSADVWSYVGGWENDRAALVASAVTKRVPQTLSVRALLAWCDGSATTEVLARLHDIKPDDMENLLKDAGVRRNEQVQ